MSSPNHCRVGIQDLKNNLTLFLGVETWQPNKHA